MENKNNDNNLKSTVESLFKGMENFITTKTVVGDAVKMGDTIILPLVEASFGIGAGAFSGDKSENAGGGMGGKISPSAVLVIQNGCTKLVNVKNQDGVTKILDMVPDIINKFTSGNDSDKPEVKLNKDEEAVVNDVLKDKDDTKTQDIKEENVDK
ncbi:Uncharacterized spore protein YtfJ [Acetitomaculum ruminis DSM 5522]|uniref:Uncharacterized spore protein YtfJ n=1 Tax=Acetitomaculum ruminis DSM 5522 TaxID=1120918 RepID=A0A1I0VHT8_9FIRM|nr:GerW family sporulation protein [Acetitomaculum ruminis]SFA75945.1 Uncharacterized spore protein YtfJ [Acetitomaculum ruminis DSM 5522]